jgi:hypothetical protein
VTTTLDRPAPEKSPRTEPDQHSELSATRHLCAGVYLDRRFRNLVIRKVYNDSRRPVAPSYGFDLVPVVRHAWRAWALEVVLLSAVLAVLIVAVVLHHALAVLTVLCWCAMYLALLDATKNLYVFLRLRAKLAAEQWSNRRERKRPARDLEERSKRKRRFKTSFACCVLLGLAPVPAARALHTSLHAVLPKVAVYAGALLVCGVAIGVLRQLQLNANQHAHSLRPRTLTRREEAIDQQQDPTCVVYQRPVSKKDTDPFDLLTGQEKYPSPFVGSGQLVHRWLPPMTVQLLRPDLANLLDMAQREHATPPFDAHQLVDHLRFALRQLTTAPGSENLPGLHVRDRLYIAEADVSADRKLLGANDFEIRRIIDNPLAPAHHFLETSVPIAGGELVTTVLIRVSLKGRCLSLDVATCALTRTPGHYQVTDQYGEDGIGAVIRAALRAVCALPRDVLMFWRLVAVPVLAARAWWAAKDRTHKPRRGVPVSPRVSLREKVADEWKNAQLDRTTIYDHMKIIEQRVLKATLDFLKAHDVDTSEFEQQATNIINSGVLNMGGTMVGDNTAVANSAKVMLGAAQELQNTAKGQSA